MISGSFTRYVAVATTVILIILISMTSHQYATGGPLAQKFAANVGKYKDDAENIGNETNPIFADLQSPSNETLGFQSIHFINLPHRFDYADAMALQGMAAGLKLNEFMGVTTDEIKAKGLAPQSSEFGKPQAACFRSHANVWRKIVNENIKTMLVMESDATFDVNIKDIMKRFAAGLAELQKSSSAVLKSNDLVATEEDPYISDNWDLLTFAYCYEGENWHNDSVKIKDPHAPDQAFYEDEEKVGLRRIRRSNSPICTTAYGISQQGARKLLLRSAIDYNKPVDLVIADLVRAEQLVAYSTSPVIFSQWEYVKGIGAEQLNTNIDTRPDEDTSEYFNAWEKAHRERNVWRLNYMYQNSIREPIFSTFSEFVYGNITANPDHTLDKNKMSERLDELKAAAEKHEES